jgi:glycosyltransferase involved in cell wall biosynthesis
VVTVWVVTGVGVHRRPRILLARQGDTPIVNRRLAEVLGDAFPDHTVVDVDLLAALRRRRGRAAIVFIGAALEHGADVVRRRTDLKRAVLTSAAFTRFARREVQERASPGDTSFVLQSQSLYAADVPGVPHIVYTDHVHLANLGYPGFDRRHLLPAAFLRRESGLYARCAAILVRSTNVRDVLVHGYGVDQRRVSVVGVGPNATVSTKISPDRRWHGGRIVFVGVDWERKGGPVLLDAFGRLRAEHPTARLDVVGPSKGRDPQPGVTFHGRLPLTSIGALLERSDVFCLPTLAEPFGVVFIEAMWAGLPVVGTRLGAQPDFILPGRTGELVPPNDPAALAEALGRLLGDPDRTRRMGRCAAHVARTRYSWPTVEARLRRSVLDSIERDRGPDGPDSTSGATVATSTGCLP